MDPITDPEGALIYIIETQSLAYVLQVLQEYCQQQVDEEPDPIEGDRWAGVVDAIGEARERWEE